jgi:hypothetical protein
MTSLPPRPQQMIMSRNSHPTPVLFSNFVGDSGVSNVLRGRKGLLIMRMLEKGNPKVRNSLLSRFAPLNLDPANHHREQPDCLVCCIYHKPKRFDESSDESSDESGDDGRARPAPSRRAKPRHTHDHHSHSDSPCGSPSEGTSTTGSESGVVTELERPQSPNAYEVQPRNPKHRNGGLSSP